MTAPRHDLYRHIHKGLRCALFDSVRRFGQLDAEDEGELQSALEGAERLLVLLAAHVKHENDFVHCAIEARRPGGAQHTAGDHRDHLETLQALHAEVQALRRAEAAERPLPLHRLYRHLALFAAENLEHMNTEEMHNNELLWSLYSDEELEALHDRLLAAIDPQIKLQAMGWIVEATNPQELAALLADMRGKAPAPAFAALLGQVRDRLSQARWAKVTCALGLDAELQPA
jgi:hypothetical protein